MGGEIQRRRHISTYGLPRYYSGEHYLNYNAASGLTAYHEAEKAAEEGSRQLLDATQSLFRTWEHDNGFVEGAAQILLPAGWRAR